jgi:hypothetical protein
VVRKVNPRERLFTPGDDDGYHDTPVLDAEVDKLYQEEKLSASFVVEPSPELDHLDGDVDGIQTLGKWK